MRTSEERLIFCNDSFAVINKAAGEVCSSEEGKIDPRYYVPEVFRSAIEEALSHKVELIECVNRIDRPVSGLVLLALSEESQRILKMLFSTKEKVHKKYWAIIEGVEDATDVPVSISDYMIFNPSRQKAYICDKEHRKSKYAELYYQVKGSGERYSYLEVQLVTGRTHQIRAQLAHRNMHIRGDLKYGAKRSDSLQGIRLHAACLDFMYPGDKRYSFTAPVLETDALWNDALRFLEPCCQKAEVTLQGAASKEGLK